MSDTSTAGAGGIAGVGVGVAVRVGAAVGVGVAVRVGAAVGVGARELADDEPTRPGSVPFGSGRDTSPFLAFTRKYVGKRQVLTEQASNRMRSTPVSSMGRSDVAINRVPLSKIARGSL
ncbi:MAG: hypothetical protein FJY29_11830 [Betaproteobacteria bacterium]|nr:hypothetical protein [Betaproteobacteria bacterium]